MMRLAARIYIVLVIVLALLIITGCAFLIFVKYDTFITQIVRIIPKDGIKSLLERSVLPPAKFHFIQKMCYAVIGILPLIVFALLKLKRKIIHVFSLIWKAVCFAWNGVFKVYQANTAQQNAAILILLLIICIKSLYYIITWNLQYDEAWCYNYFTAQPFYFSFFMYSNYPLYEISTQLFKWLPFPMKINLRLPVLLTGLLACFILYAFLKKYFRNHFTALAGTALFAFMPVTTFYMLYARGVIFELFFSILALFSLLFWLQNRQSKYLIIYVLANVLGIYSMPTHLFFWLTLFLSGIIFFYLRYKFYSNKFFLANLSVIILASLLYLLIWAGSGFSFIKDSLNKGEGLAGNFENPLYTYYTSISKFLTGFKSGLIFLLLILFFFLFLKKSSSKYRFINIFFIALTLLPALIYLPLKFSIPERAIAFTGLAIPFTGCLLFEQIKRNINSFYYFLIIISLSIMEFIISNNHRFLNWSTEEDKKAITLTNFFIKNNIITCYDNSTGSGFFYYYPLIEYYYRLQNNTISFTVAAPNSIRYKPLLPSDNYDCIIYKLNDIDSLRINKYRTSFIDTSQNFKILTLKK